MSDKDEHDFEHAHTSAITFPSMETFRTRNL